MSYVAKSVSKALTIVLWFLLIAGISFLVSLVVLEGKPSYEVDAQEDIRNVSASLQEYIQENDDLNRDDPITSLVSGGAVFIKVGDDELSGIQLSRGIDVEVTGTVESYKVRAVKEKQEIQNTWGL